MIKKVNDYKKNKISTSFSIRLKGKDTKFTMSAKGLAIRTEDNEMFIPKELLQLIRGMRD